MTTQTILAPAHASFPSLTGLSVADTQHPIQTYSQLGGPGRVANKALAIPVHLGPPWHSIEYVCVPAGHNGVGEHLQATDEIYLICSGTGRLTTNGIEEQVGPGTLVMAPKGTRHRLLNASSTDQLSFLVVEVQTDTDQNFARLASTRTLFHDLHASMQQHRSGAFSSHAIKRGTTPLFPPVVEVDLQQSFGGAWRSLVLLELPAGCSVDPYCDTNDRLLFVMSGYASIRIALSKEEEIRVETTDEAVHHSVVVPRGVPCGFGNKASGAAYPLLLACLTVRRDQHPSPSSWREGSAR
ncbi:cupin domain-containing protein [Dictyobacter arantiisoli]|uniref:Cupin type-2 domain-containing protein n=1 Tax=Dictyobacter arantiisoli TaxID=2014874 RepID=A0A5A5TJ43_9CHLR|nr:cupin domain-containing protein [Dictyobacter arantiisoli]GCF11238.1 hypothetical protein KDI_48020 [Dictyobacter arantiisoli]